MEPRYLDPEEERLRPQILLFVERYVVTLNATQAAKEAGYSERTAYAQGSRLLKRAEVARAVERRLQRATQEVREEAQIERSKVLRELAVTCFSDISVFELTEEGVKLKEGVDPSAWRAVQKIRVKFRGENTAPEVEIGLYNKLDALQMAGKHINLWEAEGLSDDELARMSEAQLVALRKGAPVEQVRKMGGAA